MNNEQSIMKSIQAEYDAFNNAPYSGQPPLPKDIIEKFKICVFKLPPASHRLSTETIKKIIGKKVKDLNNMDVPTILNTITLLPFQDLYPNLETALIKNKEIEILKLDFNLLVKQITEQLEGKKSNMLKLIDTTRQPLKIAQA